MKKLYRSDTNKKLAGICGGIGEMLNVDPTVVRLLAVVLAIATAFIPFTIGYILAWWIIPTASEINPPQST